MIPDDDDDQDYLCSNGSEAFIVESWMEPNELRIKSLWEWPDPDEVPLKIAVCGAGGTGKRALANALSDKLGVPLIDGVVRQCHSLGFNINKSATMEDEFAIFFSYLWTILEFDEFVSAGSVVDVLAHMKYIVDKTGAKYERLLQRAVANCAHLLATSCYSVFIYLPLEQKPNPDGVRSVDMKFQSAIDSNIKFYLNAFDLDYFPIGGSKKDKFATAWKYLDEFGLLVDRD